MSQFTKKELVEYIAATNDLTKKQAEEVVTGIFRKLTDELIDGTEISIHGFGKFSVKNNPARTLRPFGGAEMPVPASKGIKFSASATLKNSLNTA